jgi:hypothetical protein
MCASVDRLWKLREANFTSEDADVYALRFFTALGGIQQQISFP